MKKIKLEKEEKDLLEAVESGEFESVLTDKRKEYLQNIAEKTFNKDKRINIRLSNRDLQAIKSKATRQGIPYQTFVSSIIHKYISGSLRDITAENSSKSSKD